VAISVLIVSICRSGQSWPRVPSLIALLTDDRPQ